MASPLTRNQWILIVVPIVAAIITVIGTLMAGSSGDETNNNCTGSSQCGDGNNRVENGPQPSAS
ncbi:hypothetical protein [Streptomyces sp. NPDC002054]|uniref:hypothetical protein n=1 Tax=Streptomyces sp. NPDC002054 TaxID=3154663 RepID=UPI00331B2592